MKDKIIAQFRKAGLKHSFTTSELMQFIKTHEDSNLPSLRTIQRLFGGVPEFRASMGLGDADKRQGDYRAKKSKDAHKASRKAIDALFTTLCSRYSRSRVHRPYMYDENGHQSCSLGVHYGGEKKTDVIEVVTGITVLSFIQTIGQKLKKHIPAMNDAFINKSYKLWFVLSGVDAEEAATVLTKKYGGKYQFVTHETFTKNIEEGILDI